MTMIDNQNYLQATGFKLLIPHERYRNTEWFVQSVDHPSISSIPADLGYEGFQGVPQGGDKVIYPEVSFELILDVNMKGYKELYEWIVTTVTQPPKSLLERIPTEIPRTLDITLVILDSQNKPNNKITYKDAFPISLGNFSMLTTEPSPEPIKILAAFQYTYFEIE